MQRLRGVRQLGLAQYVFPGAGHDRLEHVCGVVGAVEATIQSLRRQRERVALVPGSQPLPDIDEARRFELRLAGLLHDIGHGPFSHAIEPVLQHPFQDTDAGDPADNWRADIAKAQRVLQQHYVQNKRPSVSETLAVMMVASPALGAVLGHQNFVIAHRRQVDIQEVVVASIVGAVEGPGADHLSRVVSSQIDADKLDYLARDAHHAGLEIGFETNRLLAKLEVLAVREDRLGDAAEDLKERARRAPGGVYYDVGIAASGFGSFEQMLIGRTFLYDRLYHHHKVRAADAMAQRLAITAQEERGARLSLEEVFERISDDTMIRVLGGEVTHPAIAGGGTRASGLARAILDRELYHRAFAFRGRFIACPALKERDKEDLRQNKWGALVKELDSLSSRMQLERQIFTFAQTIGTSLRSNFPEDEALSEAMDRLAAAGAEQIIVDLPESKADAIRILARYPNDRLAVPEFSFNPVKWADAYDLQKRTGYVFCPRETVALVGLAAKLMFLKRFGLVMAKEADGYIKAPEIRRDWLEHLLAVQLVDQEAVQHLKEQRFSLLRINLEDVPVPQEWLEEDPDLGVRLAIELDALLPAGLIASEKEALTKTLKGIFRFVDSWHNGGDATADLVDERALQAKVRPALHIQGIKVAEAGALSGGEFDLVAEDRVVIENKIADAVRDPFDAKAAAATQGRRYAIALGGRVVLVVMAYVPKPGQFPTKTKSVLVRKIDDQDDRRAEIRVILPYRAPVPSREKRLSASPDGKKAD
jgi:HD superfamily phosphohydrolase